MKDPEASRIMFFLATCSAFSAEETAKMLMTEMPASSLVAECVDVAAQGDCRRCKQYVVLGMVVLEQILRPSIRLKCWHP